MDITKLLSKLYKVDIQDALKKLGQERVGIKSELISALVENNSQEQVLNVLTAADLKWLCNEVGLKSTGKKENFVARLIEYLNDTNNEEKSEDNIFIDPIQELHEQVGLKEVKNHVEKINALLKVQKFREEAGLEPVKVSNHMVFTGNPGSGKTTVAEIVAKIYKGFGFLSKGEIVQVTRSDFIGQHLGESEDKAKELFNKALGGVMFIDEAYSIFQGKNDSYGKAILPAFLTNLEKHREDMVVILAGYQREMEVFLNSDPGLRSRFSKFIHFDDYTPAELMQIMKKIASEKDYKVDALLSDALLTYFEKALDTNNFSNGRFVRNVFEKLVQNQSLRVSRDIETINREQLETLTIEDFESL